MSRLMGYAWEEAKTKQVVWGTPNGMLAEAHVNVAAAWQLRLPEANAAALRPRRQGLDEPAIAEQLGPEPQAIRPLLLLAEAKLAALSKHPHSRSAKRGTGPAPARVRFLWPWPGNAITLPAIGPQLSLSRPFWRRPAPSLRA